MFRGSLSQCPVHGASRGTDAIFCEQRVGFPLEQAKLGGLASAWAFTWLPGRDYSHPRFQDDFQVCRPAGKQSVSLSMSIRCVQEAHDQGLFVCPQQLAIRDTLPLSLEVPPSHHDAANEMPSFSLCHVFVFSLSRAV